MRRFYILSVALVGLVLSACARDDGNDYSKVQGQTGGPEQGVWQDKAGTRLDLNSGKFVYARNGNSAKGDYKVEDGKITMTGDVGGGTYVASFPDPGGPLRSTARH